jgi:hypothetical protein
MTTRLAVLGLALLMLAGCWSKGPTETVPEPKSTAPQAPAGSAESADRPLTREIKSGDYRLTLELASQVLRLNVSKPESPRTEGTILADDSVTVVPATADVRVEDRVVARVKAGQVLAVSQVQGDFIGVSLLVDGQPVSGWLRRHEVAFKTAESKLVPTLAGIRKSDMVPAAMLVQKAKAFDDGLYAAVELAAQEGAGTFAGKRSMLSALVASVLQPPLAEKSPIVLLAGAKLGGVVEHLPPALEPEIAAAMASFERDSARSLPISFYTWSPDLERIFQQDRMLQTPLEPGEVETLVEALSHDAASLTSYETYLELVSRLTNPLAKPDLRSMLAGAAAAPGRDEICFFPPSRSFEGDLLRRLIGPGPVPDDFELMNELISQVRSGKLSLTPTASSGWYDYTAWALEPMIVPDKVAEADHLELSDSYREHLTELFKGSLALARETHIKEVTTTTTSEMLPGAGPRRPEFTLQPELSAEPLATSYLRRAQGYRFVAGALESTFGRQALEKMHRLTQAGPVSANLSEELASMEDLFLGAASVVARQLGMEKIVPDELAARAKPAERAFRDWSADRRKDADLAGDLRMMVPVYIDPANGRIKVWVLLGWTQQDCEIAFAKEPKAIATDASGKPLDSEQYNVFWSSSRQTLATPVVAEVYVTQLLNRDEFRKHCDAYWTPAAILANLK